MKIEMTKIAQVEIKKINVFVKVRDEGNYDFIDQDDEVVLAVDEYYVPSFFPGDHGSDYLDLEIDIETGQILNWVAPSSEALSEYILKQQERIG